MSTTTVGNAPTQHEAPSAVRRVRRGRVIGSILLLALLLVLVLAAFRPFPWQLLGQGLLLLTIVVVVLSVVEALVLTLAMAAITRTARTLCL